jgi:hypothetical protein
MDSLVDTFQELNISSTLIKSQDQTKLWRTNQEWYINGKHNECEIYQRNIIEQITDTTCNKCNLRLNSVTYELREYNYPMKHVDGYEWSEDFDGYIGKYNFYINFKMVCCRGGSQTRTLKQVYNFILYQLNYKLINNDNIYFINILDGDESYRNNNKFKYLINKDIFESIKDYIFVGDMVEFYDWFNSQFNR